MSTTEPGPTVVELEIGGMTCASSAARVEKKHHKLAGVTATVNYATETARVQVSGEVSVDDLVQTVEDTGYTAQLPPSATGEDGDHGNLSLIHI
jgi:Cu+-exporting ATPase